MEDGLLDRGQDWDLVNDIWVQFALLHVQLRLPFPERKVRLRLPFNFQPHPQICPVGAVTEMLFPFQCLPSRPHGREGVPAPLQINEVLSIFEDELLLGEELDDGVGLAEGSVEVYVYLLGRWELRLQARGEAQRLPCDCRVAIEMPQDREGGVNCRLCLLLVCVLHHQVHQH